jgi:DNA-binding CsgD family transcriptional regulator
MIDRAYRVPQGLVKRMTEATTLRQDLPLASGLGVSVLRGVAAGVALGEDGATAPLPGLGDDPLLAPGSAVLEAASAAMRGGQISASFLWPRGGQHAPEGHVRVTALRNTEVGADTPRDVVLISSGVELSCLTPRELEVLGMVIEGWTNREIARALAVVPRTVAAHVEHILIKMDAESRTLAAVRAVRSGLYVPPQRS